MQEIEDQLIQKYENLLLQAQQYKKPEREMTIFDTALKNHHENPITELLSFFLDPNEKHQLEELSLSEQEINNIARNINNIVKALCNAGGVWIKPCTRWIDKNGRKIVIR